MELDIGMLFCRVCFHYGMSYQDCMRLPMKTFWMLNRNIGRVLAEQDLRALEVAVAATGGEAIQALHTKLTIEFDNPYHIDPEIQAAPVIDEKRDEAGFAQLKLM